MKIRSVEFRQRKCDVMSMVSLRLPNQLSAIHINTLNGIQWKKIRSTVSITVHENSINQEYDIYIPPLEFIAKMNPKNIIVNQLYNS
jgi:hypothetical protein